MGTKIALTVLIITWTTLTTSRREKGSVAMTRMTETRVRRTEQMPGPSSQPPALTEPEPEQGTDMTRRERITSQPRVLGLNSKMVSGCPGIPELMSSRWNMMF